MAVGWTAPPGVTGVVVTSAGSVSWSWSCSVGKGCSSWMSALMASPHRFSCQSMKVPLYSLTIVSLTITVHLPMPDSPLW